MVRRWLLMRWRRPGQQMGQRKGQRRSGAVQTCRGGGSEKRLGGREDESMGSSGVFQDFCVCLDPQANWLSASES